MQVVVRCVHVFIALTTIRVQTVISSVKVAISPVRISIIAKVATSLVLAIIAKAVINLAKVISQEKVATSPVLATIAKAAINLAKAAINLAKAINQEKAVTSREKAVISSVKVASIADLVLTVTILMQSTA